MVTGEAAVAGAGVRRYAANPADLPRGTLVDLFLEAIALERARAQLHRAEGGWLSISHAEVSARVQSITAAMRAYGIERGDRIGILAENRPEWAWADYAALCGGALTVPLYPTLPATQMAHVLRHSACRMLFVSTAEQLAKVGEIRADLPALERVVVFDEVATPGAGVQTLSALMEHGVAQGRSDAEFRAEAKRARPDDVATLIYTSGTTGEPKGVMLTHANVHSNVIAATRHVLKPHADDIALSFLPLSHIFQRMVDFQIFSLGTPIAYVANIDLVAQALEEVRPTIVVAVPRVYEKLYAKVLAATGVKRRLVLWARQVALDWAKITLAGDSPGAALRVQHTIADRLVYSKLRAKLGGRLRFFVSGSAPLSPQIALFFYGAGVVILEGYGLTETSPVTNVNQPEAMRVGTVGKPIPGTEIRIADDGEILVRGPQVMKGYYHNEAATREVIDEEGWFHTGDIGSIDEDDFLRITDRKKDLLVTAGGKNVAPQPIQNAVKMSRYVTEAVLIGDRRPYTILMVVPNFETVEEWGRQQGLSWDSPAALAADPRVRKLLEREAAQRLDGFARYELPKKVLPLAREFSLERGEITPSLKVKRQVVEQVYSDQIEALYAEPAPASDQ
ncbi:MAG: long-chain fatty acid--CoA ligase [Gemmatimonadota bacterium]